MDKYVVVCGSLNMDVVCHVPCLPKPGETIIGSHLMTNVGGKGGNQAVGIAKAGLKVYMIGAVGDDDYGKKIVESLEHFGVLTDWVKKEQCNSGTALITVEESGENVITVIPGANSYVTKSNLDEAKEMLKKAHCFVAQLEIPVETVESFFEIGRTYGGLNVLDPAPMPPSGLSDSLLKLVDLLTPNETEMKQLSGIDIVDLSSFKKAAVGLHEKGVKEIVCTAGKNGVYYSNGDEQKYVPGKIVKTVDTTCAGDTFTAFYIAKKLENADYMEALLYGNKAAAVTVTREGAAISIPTKKEIDKGLSYF